MTLNDLVLLMRRYLAWVIIFPLSCALLAGGAAALKDVGGATGYSATATLTVTDPTNSLSSTNLTLLLNATAKNAVSGESGGEATVTAVPEDKTQSVRFIAAAPTAELAESAADGAAEDVLELMQATLSAQADVFKESISGDDLEGEKSDASVKAAALEACVYTVAPSEAVAGGESSSVAKYAAVGLLAGLFVVVLALAIYDSVRRPVKDRRDIASVTNLPVLNGSGGASGAELVRASLASLCGKMPKTICVVSEGETSGDFVDQLEGALCAAGEDVQVKVIAPLSESPSGCLEVQKADATFVCVVRWKSTMAGVANVLEELKLTGAQVSGIVLV